jgi:SAM-dependent methyltransferase
MDAPPSRTAKILAKKWAPRPLLRWYQEMVRGQRFAPPVGRVRMGDLRRLQPFSRYFGYDRGLPVDRYYIERFLAAEADRIHGRVLEVGDNAYTMRFGGTRVTTSDVLHVHSGNPAATIVDDLAKGDQIPSDAFDCIVLTQTLHLIFDLTAAVATLHRMLKPGGSLLLTAPGITQLSTDEWNAQWYWAFTTGSLRRLFEAAFPSDHLQIAAHGNVLAAIAFLEGMATADLQEKELQHHDPQYELLITLIATKPQRR